jgi:hypothetical protein
MVCTEKVELTLVSLLLNLDNLGEVFVLLPLDIGAECPLVDKVACIPHLLLIDIRLLENRVLEVVIRREYERELVT